ncbi:MAG: UDP-2,3-diacylglucosamine diphosphatase LpxI [Myxococcota bacterium]
MSRLGLIAGRGRLPILAAAAVRAGGVSIRALALEGLADPALAGEVDAIRWLRVGRLEAAAEALRSMDVKSVLLVGSVPKRLLRDGQGLVELDGTARSLLGRLASQGDDAILRALLLWLEAVGFDVVSQSEALAPLLAPAGVWSQRAPTAGERADVEVGRAALARGAGADGGQCVVVHRARVVAVEAIEGTDDAIRRAGRLVGPGAVVVKAGRPGQDRRIDLPAVGPDTIAVMREVGACCLAVEAGLALILERQSTRAAADRAGIACLGFDAGQGAS